MSAFAAKRHKPASKLLVNVLSLTADRGQLQFGQIRMPCALGRSGIGVLKREGDGMTPRGRFAVRHVLYRLGSRRPRTQLELRTIHRNDGWCDSPSDRNYNRLVRMPYPASAERLWRADELYDIVVVLGYNDVPRVRNRGSAIFIHLAREGFKPTEGCIALRDRDLRRLISMLPRRSEIVIPG
jgi:L,D-peptidoglycan transpeptidase YkuD (ErfK/YbiS/YcfS/YnhG family)